MAVGGYRERNATADRALTILSMFEETRATISASDVAEALGVARSTAYRYLQTLIRAGFLEENPGGGFGLGIRVLQLARIARRTNGLAELARPKMRSLASRLRQAVLLTRLSGDVVVCVEREEWSGESIRLSYESGSVMEVNAGASALILLPWLPEERVRAMLQSRPPRQFTPATTTDPDQLIERLRRIRKAGHVISRGELDRDVVGVAAPVFDSSGTVAAGLSIVALRSRVDDDAIEVLLRGIVETAQQLSAQLALVDA